MMEQSSLSLYAEAARRFLAGEIEIGLFGSMPVPDAPEDVAMIVISGAMMKADYCGSAGTRTIANAVKAAANSDKYKSIILYFENVPGGQVDGTEALANEVKAATAQKPVLSIVSGMCCSAGIWVASQSTEIYATSATDQIGCIGVLARFSKKDDGTVDVVADNTPHKNEEYKDYQVLKDMYLNPVAEMFQNAVRSGRGDVLKEAEKVLTGGTFISPEAKKHGLIDGVMSFEKVIQRANYLSNKNKNQNMKENNATAAQFPFDKVLNAANAEALEPIEQGFAISEDQLTALEASIAAAQENESTSATRIQELEATIAANAETIAAHEATIEAHVATIAAHEATIASYTGKPAPVAADPVAAADPVEDSGKKYLTSVDEEAARLYAEF